MFNSKRTWLFTSSYACAILASALGLNVLFAYPEIMPKRHLIYDKRCMDPVACTTATSCQGIPPLIVDPAHPEETSISVTGVFNYGSCGSDDGGPCNEYDSNQNLPCATIKTYANADCTPESSWIRTLMFTVNSTGKCEGAI
jgi:hypothetical protein